MRLTELDFVRTLGSCFDRASSFHPRICRQRSRAIQRCAVAVPIFLFFEGRASAASGTKAPRGLVDVHHHENTVCPFQDSPWVGGNAESHSVTTTTTSVTAAWGGSLTPLLAPVEEMHPDYLPAEGFAPSKVCADNGKCVCRSCWLVCTLRQAKRDAVPFASERSPVSSLDLPKRAISLHGKEICSVREGWRVVASGAGGTAASWTRRVSSEL